MGLFYAWSRSLKGCVMFFLTLKHLAVSSWMKCADSVIHMNTGFVILGIILYFSGLCFIC